MSKKGRKGKNGKPFELVVAEVAKAMDPQATVVQGEWVAGPDGRRDMDVRVSGTVDGQPRTAVIECKDYDPKRTGPVGITVVDSLESKRRDLPVDVALICSNAGFTADAIRKANRVGIGLIGVMRKGDNRIRTQVTEEIYTRRIKVESLTFELLQAGSPVGMEGVPTDAIRYNGIPISNWVTQRVALLLGANLIVGGRYKHTHRLTASVSLEVPNGLLAVDGIGYRLHISGGWFEHRVTLDATAAVYDWLRRRVRLVPGPSQFSVNQVNLHAGDAIEKPPDEEFHSGVRRGEVFLRLMLVDGLGALEPVPELDQFVIPEDLELVMTDLPEEAYVSTHN